MASAWGIIIDQQTDGSITFTPDVPGAKVGQPLGVNSGDDVTWNNRTNQTITLQSIQPPTPFPFGPIPAGGVSNPIFNVTETVGYSRMPTQKRGAARKTASTPDAWIVVV
jgi:hypothetical protein